MRLLLYNKSGKCPGIESEPSDEVCITTGSNPNWKVALGLGGDVTPLPGDKHRPEKVSLAWQDGNNMQIFGYHVYKGVNGGPRTLLGSTQGSGFDDFAVSEGNVYSYHVAAYTQQGQEVYHSGAITMDMDGILGNGPERVKTHYFHKDHLGSVRSITDDDGNIVSTHYYLPFGEEVPPEGGNPIYSNSTVVAPQQAMDITTCPPTNTLGAYPFTIVDPGSYIIMVDGEVDPATPPGEDDHIMPILVMGQVPPASLPCFTCYPDSAEDCMFFGVNTPWSLNGDITPGRRTLVLYHYFDTPGPYTLILKGDQTPVVYGVQVLREFSVENESCQEPFSSTQGEEFLYSTGGLIWKTLTVEVQEDGLYSLIVDAVAETGDRNNVGHLPCSDRNNCYLCFNFSGFSNARDINCKIESGDTGCVDSEPPLPCGDCCRDCCPSDKLRFEVVDTETSERIDFEWVSQESFLGDRDFGVRRQLAIPVYLEAGETEPKEYDIVIYAVGSPTLYSVKLCPATLTWVMPFHTDREKFTSKERDKETGLDYFGARYYASWLSRWLSVDPVRGKVGDSQSWNRYIYVQNNPLRLIDPNGTTITASNNIEEARQQLEVLKTAAGAGGKHLQVVPFEKKVLWSKVTGYRIEATDLQALSKSGIVGNALASWIASSAILNINWAGFWSDQATPSQGGANTTFSNEGATINMRPEYYEKPRKFGDVTQTMASAFIHELGHSLYKLFPSLIERNNKGEFGRVETEIFPEYNRDEAFPLYFENLNRSAEEQRKYYANPGDYTPPKVPPQYPLW